ncbi:MAG: hypothetical protein ABIG60_03940 [Patescibacteria group bacterium]
MVIGGIEKFKTIKKRETSSQAHREEFKKPKMTELRSWNLYNEGKGGSVERKKDYLKPDKEYEEIDVDRFLDYDINKIENLREDVIEKFLRKYFSTINYNIKELEEDRIDLEKFFLVKNFDYAHPEKMSKDANNQRKEYKKKLNEIIEEINKLDDELKNQILNQPGASATTQKKDRRERYKRQSCELQLEIWRAERVIEKATSLIDEDYRKRIAV